MYDVFAQVESLTLDLRDRQDIPGLWEDRLGGDGTSWDNVVKMI